MENELRKVENACKLCAKCELSKTRSNVVFGDGTPNNKIVLIGEAPGRDEDMQGKPFVGRSGQLLDKILESVGFSRKINIYIMNTVKCRPPENRNPLPGEKTACREFLDEQLRILSPKIILLCGAVAVTSMLDTKDGITKIRGKWFDMPNGMRAMPIFHPAYLLRNPSKEAGKPKWLMWQDMKEIKRVYDNLS
ncbi:MAG: uracil-DNA glycosylase [Rickettsiales bacterium]|jgi:DNA polymerase|nr:uracil-DNA glycosylase [Rickettsiales bacterium]